MSRPSNAAASEEELRSALQERLPGLIDGLSIIAGRRLADADDAEDAVQETIARLISGMRLGRIETAEEIGPVAYGILRHVIADQLRLRQRRVALEDAIPHPGPDVLEALERHDEAQVVRGALARLAPEDRVLLQRCFVDGERIARIAAQAGEPAERLRQRKFRALKRLAELIRGAVPSRLAGRADLDV